MKRALAAAAALSLTTVPRLSSGLRQRLRASTRRSLGGSRRSGVRQSANQAPFRQVSRAAPVTCCTSIGSAPGFPLPALLPKSLFKKSARGSSRLGIALGSGNFAVAYVRREAGNKPVVEHCATHQAGSDLGPALKAVLEKLGATRAPACAVIDGDDYQVVQVEAPDVLPTELRAAIRWRLRETVGFDVDHASVDTFEVPEPVRRTETKMLYAVAARDAAVRRITETVQPLARGFDAIDIPELCIRNVAAMLPQDAKGVAMLAVHEQSAHLVVTRQGVMYLTRRIDTKRGFNPHATSRNALNIDAGSLALELQRSLDYYESHYDQSPIGDLVIAPVNDRTRALMDALKSETGLRLAVLEANEVFDVRNATGSVSDWLSLLALGGALRTDADPSARA
jgi:MSHA biogenesis protein MshI